MHSWVGRAILAVWLAACLLLSVSTAAGQTVGATTGAINGTVTDSTGAVLPRVTITVSSDALIGNSGTRTAVTTEKGLFRFLALPPGEYTLAFTLKSFRTVTRVGIYVGVGFTATLDVELQLEALNQGVTVERTSPVLDRQSTAIVTTFDRRQLADLPGARSMGTVLSATPAVQVTRFDVGGNTENTGAYSAYGTEGQNRPMVEGLVVARILGTGFALNYGSFDEVSVGTAVHGAEWPLAGVQMQFIAKSGGNRYRGTLYADYENKDWQSFNIDDDQVRRGAQEGGGLSPRHVNRVWSYRDINADVGGYLKPDVLWWYSSFRDQDVSARSVNFPVKPRRTHITSYSGKATYQITPKNKLVGFAQTGRNHQPNVLGGFTLGATTAVNLLDDSTAEQLALGWIWKGEWNSVINERMLFELRVGQFGADRPEKPNGTAPRFEDAETLIVRGGNRNWQTNLRREQVLGSLDYFRDDWLGNHHLKVGGDILRTTTADIWRAGYPDDVLHVVRNGEPSEVYLFQTPSRSTIGEWTYSGHASDSWRVNDRLTLNLGLRFDRYRVFLPEQVHPVSRFNPAPQTFAAVDNVRAWNVVAPRIGIIHDVASDGRTIAKFSYGQYRGGLAPDIGFNANPNSNPWWRRYTWRDIDGSSVWERGEEGALLARRGGLTIERVDPRLELLFVEEVGGWIERELAANLGVRTGVVWRAERQHRMRQNANWSLDAFALPVTILDPGADGRSNTVDDGPEIVAYNLKEELLGLQDNILRNVANSDSQYWTWDIAANRRFKGRWSLVAAFAHTWNSEHSNAYLGQTVRQNVYPLTPNDLINAGEDGRYEFTTWSAKVYGTCEAPWGVRITPLLRHQSGQPFGRTFVARLNYGNVRMLAEPIGTRRMDDITLLDARVEKGFRLANNRRVAGFVDVFNVLNANPEESTSWSSGSFLRPLSIVPPRIVRLGVKVEW